MSVLIVNIRVDFSGLIEFVVFPECLVIGNGRIEWLPRSKRCFELCSSLSSLCFSKEEGTAVKIVSSLASLPSLGDRRVSFVGCEDERRGVHTIILATNQYGSFKRLASCKIVPLVVLTRYVEVL